MSDIQVILICAALIGLYVALSHISGVLVYRKNQKLQKNIENLLEEGRELHKKNLDLAKTLLEVSGYKKSDTDFDARTLP